MKHLLKILLSALICLGGQLVADATCNVVSRLSYYTTEHQASIIILNKESVISEVAVTYRGDAIKSELIRNGANHPSIVTFPLSKLPIGDDKIDLVVEYEDNTSDLVSCIIKKLVPNKNEVKVDKLSGGMLVNNLPFIPVGFYTRLPYGNLLNNEVYNGFNLVGVYQDLESNTIDERKTYLDECAKLGIKVNYHINSHVGTHHGVDHGSEQRKLDIIKKEIETFKDHPAILAWYLNDEPLGQGRSPKEIENAYNLVKSIDPYHPVSIVFMMPSRANEFGDGLDIAMTDPYPIPGPVSAIGEAVDQLEHHFQYKKGIWYVPQTFGGGEFWVRESTPQEIRSSCYLALTKGAMGWESFIKKGPNLFPKSMPSWNAYSTFAHEVKMLTPWISSGSREVLPSSTQGVSISKWNKNGDLLIVAVNTNKEIKNLNIPLSSVTSSREASVEFEDRKISLDKGAIQEPIDAYGVRVYKIIDKNKLPSNDSIKISSSNLLVNPSFEYCPNASVPMACYASSELDPQYVGSTYSIDTRQAVEGYNSLNMHTTKDNASNTLTFYRALVKQGKSYNFSIWAKSGKGTKGKFRVDIRSEKFTKIFDITDQWKKYSFTILMEKSSGQASVSLTSLSQGDLWFDVMQLIPDPQVSIAYEKNRTATVSIETVSDSKIVYTLGKKELTEKSKEFKKPFVLNKRENLNVGLVNNHTFTTEVTIPVSIHKALFSQVKYLKAPSSKYKGGSQTPLVDGELASTSYQDRNWVGFEGENMDVTIDLGKITALDKVSLNNLISVKDGIYAAQELCVETSVDYEHFISFGKEKCPNLNLTKESIPSLQHWELHKRTKARYIHIKLENRGEVPKGFLFAGTKSWLFVDEIIVE